MLPITKRCGKPITLIKRLEENLEIEI